MSDSRERFEAWQRSFFSSLTCAPDFNNRHNLELITHSAWQAAEAPAVRRCVEVINAWANDSDRHEHMLADIEQEFPEAFK